MGDATAERLRRGGYTRESARFTSRDGVILAADLFLPAGASRASFDDDGDGASGSRVGDGDDAPGPRTIVADPAFRDGAPHAMVTCHAHPKFGGHPDMMHRLCAHVASSGCAVVNLHLRGAGASGGRGSWQGTGGEVDDARAAIDFAIRKLRARTVHLMGYSFGATVLGAAIDHAPQVATYAAIAYPLGTYHAWSKGLFGFGAKLLMRAHCAPLRASATPKLFVVGTRDCFTKASTLERFARGCAGGADANAFVEFEGADHFGFVASPWSGRVCDAVRGFIADARSRSRHPVRDGGAGPVG